MRTLALRGGERVAVDPAEWHRAFAVVTRGRVQLELRDGRPGPVLRRDAGFWLRGTGVRALHNPGRRTATVRIALPSAPSSLVRGTEPVRGTELVSGTDMNSSTDHTATAPRRTARLAGIGLAAALVAAVATTLAAALARAAGADFEIPDGGETIPLPGFAVVTAFFSVVGVVIAVALQRWSARPAERFRWTAVTLTAVSLVPPLISGANAATVVALILLHLVAAAVMIPALTRALGG
ncbi:DUF6069 family protein [Actinoplanes sp. NPDC051861]|uniref:DUF6069 family protein n=1 Tax=Actinoplanes sp. NPDC051861 TaxID=3155170 RepID=UPI0034189C7C